MDMFYSESANLICSLNVFYLLKENDLARCSLN